LGREPRKATRRAPASQGFYTQPEDAVKSRRKNAKILIIRDQNNMSKSSIQKQIARYHHLLQTREDTDPAYLPAELKELRHRIMYVHLRVEQTIQVVLAQNIFRLKLKKKEAPIIVEHFKRIAPIFDNMEFYPKIKAIQALGLMSSKLINLILKINDHRKYFSHPAAYQDKINEYRKPEKQLSTLKELHKALTELDKYILENKLLLDD